MPAEEAVKVRILSCCVWELVGAQDMGDCAVLLLLSIAETAIAGCIEAGGSAADVMNK